MTVPTQVRIDSEVKKNATIIFDSLGLDMSSAINLFLHQCVLRGGLPFSVEVPNYSPETLAAMEEARKIAKDPNTKGYSSMADLKKGLEK